MSITLRHPVPGAPWGNPFGWRAAIPSIGLPAKLHNGQDFPAASGTPVLAAATGTVVWAGWDNGSGWGVRLKHSGGYETWYWHMRDRPLVRSGQKVKVGHRVGLVGSTGQYTTGPHLHFGLSRWGTYQNPRPSIKSSAAPKPKPAQKPIIIEEEDDMRPTIHFRTAGNPEWSRCHPDIGKDLKPGQSRKDGNVTVFRGFEATTNKTVGTAWARQYARGVGNETSRTNRSGYIQIQKQATRLSVAVHG